MKQIYLTITGNGELQRVEEKEHDRAMKTGEEG